MDLWLKLFAVNWLINILCIEFLAIRKLKKIIKVDESRDTQFKAFRRNDVFWFNRPWLYLTCPIALNKILFGFFCIFVFGSIQTLVV